LIGSKLAGDGAEQGGGRAVRALLLHPYRRGAQRGRSPAASLEELRGLAAAIELDVVRADCVSLLAPRPATLIGSGKVAAVAQQVADAQVELAVVDGALTPGQQRNLEKAWKCKVIDRTGLILEIFGERARTREGRLQVDLARLSYQRGRLVRSWTHLERQRGGLGAVGGPGETQLEADRRQIDERILRLKRQLGEVTRTRELHRKRRRQAPYPLVALVGYTNAGKSTLFNRLTAAGVVAADMLFATLDPTLRLLTLPSGRPILLSDTVGFIADLPTQLVAAFRATLEEVLEADLLLHIRDISHPDSEAQGQDVRQVLRELGIDTAAADGILEVCNKLDLADEETKTRLRQASRRNGDSVAISALEGAGLEELLAAIDRRLGQARRVLECELAASDGAALAWLYRNGQVLERQDRDGRVHLRVGLDPADLGRARKLLGQAA